MSLVVPDKDRGHDPLSPGAFHELLDPVLVTSEVVLFVISFEDEPLEIAKVVVDQGDRPVIGGMGL
jgi:hypothetical protein